MLLYLFDVVALVAAAVVAEALVEPDPSTTFSWLSIAIALGSWTVVARAFDSYNVRRAVRIRQSIATVHAALIGTAVLTLIVPQVPVGSAFSRNLVVAMVLAAALSLAVARLAYGKILSRSGFQCAILVIGPEVAYRQLSGLILKEAPREYRLVGCASPTHGANALADDLEVVHGYDDITTLVRGRDVAELIIADDLGPDLNREIVELYQAGVRVRHFSDLYEELTGRIPVAYLGSHWFAALRVRQPAGRLYGMLRRLIDVAAASLALAVTAPLLGLIALAIRLDSPGPVIFRQQRSGYLGRIFTMCKFRTMVHESEAAGPVWAAAFDPRRSRVGRLLRPTRLDELPQLWNVLAGHMSLIGPRPERPTFVERLEAEVPFYRARLLVRPGISGWAQVRGAYASSVQDSIEKLEYDLYYVKHRSPYLDLVIAFRTLGVLFRASGR